jgi:hypothetical protein
MRGFDNSKLLHPIIKTGIIKRASDLKYFVWKNVRRQIFCQKLYYNFMQDYN